ncbi:hypothetical protein [Okeania sp. SIO2B3]|nr:hypothetical protein [Okeania sp. SIO2B3]
MKKLVISFVILTLIVSLGHGSAHAKEDPTGDCAPGCGCCPADSE